MRIYATITPRASKNEVRKISEGTYKIRVTAAPVDGKANEMVIRVLSEYFSLPKSAITIAGGKSAKTKIIDIVK